VGQQLHRRVLSKIKECINEWRGPFSVELNILKVITSEYGIIKTNLSLPFEAFVTTPYLRVIKNWRKKQAQPFVGGESSKTRRACSFKLLRIKPLIWETAKRGILNITFLRAL